MKFDKGKFLSKAIAYSEEEISEILHALLAQIRLSGIFSGSSGVNPDIKWNINIESEAESADMLRKLNPLVTEFFVKQLKSMVSRLVAYDKLHAVEPNRSLRHECDEYELCKLVQVKRLALHKDAWNLHLIITSPGFTGNEEIDYIKFMGYFSPNEFIFIFRTVSGEIGIVEVEVPNLVGVKAIACELYSQVHSHHLHTSTRARVLYISMALNRGIAYEDFLRLNPSTASRVLSVASSVQDMMTCTVRLARYGAMSSQMYLQYLVRDNPDKVQKITSGLEERTDLVLDSWNLAGILEKTFDINTGESVYSLSEYGSLFLKKELMWRREQLMVDLKEVAKKLRTAAVVANDVVTQAEIQLAAVRKAQPVPCSSDNSELTVSSQYSELLFMD